VQPVASSLPCNEKEWNSGNRARSTYSEWHHLAFRSPSQPSDRRLPWQRAYSRDRRQWCLPDRLRVPARPRARAGGGGPPVRKRQRQDRTAIPPRYRCEAVHSPAVEAPPKRPARPPRLLGEPLRSLRRIHLPRAQRRWFGHDAVHLPLRKRAAKIRWMAGYPFEILTWPRADCRYLMGHFNAGWPWERDYLVGGRSLVPMVKIWAHDHLCLFGRPLLLAAEPRRHR
jgi:hypothetical protein